jgi:hypothetical protein
MTFIYYYNLIPSLSKPKISSASFEAVTFEVDVLWDVTLKTRGNKVLRNVGILTQHYIASQPIRPQLE